MCFAISNYGRVLMQIDSAFTPLPEKMTGQQRLN